MRFGGILLTKKKLSLLICISSLCLIVLIVSSVMLFNHFNEAQKSKETYQDAQNAVQIEMPTTVPTVPTESTIIDNHNPTEDTTDTTETEDPYKDLKISFNISWEELYAQSDDVVGWIHIPESNINYPLVHRDNVFYLDHDYQGGYSAGGSIFLDRSCDFSEQNTIIYGHHMQSDTMFHRLPYYAQQDYAESHQYFYIVTENETRLYQVFAVRYTEGGSETYVSHFDTHETFDNYIQLAKEQSLVVLSNEDISSDDMIVTLSTCSGRSGTERLVVQGLLVSSY